MNRLLYAGILLFLFVQTSFAQTDKQMEMLHSGKVSDSDFTEIIPIEIWQDLILLKTSVNGTEGTFIWNNGSSSTGLDKAFAKKAGIDFNKNNISGTDGFNRAVQFNLATAETIAIGKIIITLSPLFKMDTSFRDTNKHIDGTLGASVINLLNWNFDFDKNIVTISDKLFEETGMSLKYRIDAYNLHYMPLKVNNYDFTDARIDFGSNSDPWAITADDLSAFPNAKKTREYGFIGVSEFGLSNIDTSYLIKNNYTYSLSGKTFNYLPVIELTKNVDGINIGNRFFRRGNVIINSFDSTYILYSRKTTTISEIPVKGFGIRLVKINNNIVIGKLTDNPNVKGKNIQLMSVVKEVNGKPAGYFPDNFFLSDYQDDLLQKEKSLTIKLKGGTVYTFIPESDYGFYFFY